MSGETQSVVEDEEFVDDIIDEPEPTDVDSGSEALASEEPKQPSGDAGAQATEETGKRVETVPGQEPAQPTEPTQPNKTAEPTGEAEFPAFQYRAYGQQYDLPGSKWGEDGVFVPTEALPQLQRLLSRAESASRRESEFKSEITKVRRETKGQYELAQQVLTELDGLRRDPEKLAAWFEDLDRNWDLMMARAEAEQAKAAASQYQELLRSHDNQATSEALVPRIEDTLWNSVRELAGMPEFQGLEAREMYHRIANSALLDRVFYEASDDMPEIGVQKGGIVFDSKPILAEFQYHAQLLKRASKQAADAMKKNQAATAVSKAPPDLSGSGGEPPASGEPPKFKSREEMEAWLESGAWKKTFA